VKLNFLEAETSSSGRETESAADGEGGGRVVPVASADGDEVRSDITALEAEVVVEDVAFGVVEATNVVGDG